MNEELFQSIMPASPSSIGSMVPGTKDDLVSSGEENLGKALQGVIPARVPAGKEEDKMLASIEQMVNEKPAEPFAEQELALSDLEKMIDQEEMGKQQTSLTSKGIAPHIAGAMATTLSEKRNILRKFYGKENVKIEDDKLMISSDGGKSFKMYDDPSSIFDMGSLYSVAADIPEGLLAGAGVSAMASVVSPYFVVPGIAMGAAGLFLSHQMASLVREGAVVAMGGKDSYDASNVMRRGTENFLGDMASKAIMSIPSMAVEGFKKVREARPRTAKEFAALYNELDSMARGIYLKYTGTREGTETIGGKKINKAFRSSETGGEPGVIQNIINEWNNSLDIFKSEAAAFHGDNRYSMENAKRTIRGFLEDRGALFDPETGLAKMDVRSSYQLVGGENPIPMAVDVEGRPSEVIKTFEDLFTGEKSSSYSVLPGLDSKRPAPSGAETIYKKTHRYESNQTTRGGSADYDLTKDLISKYNEMISQEKTMGGYKYKQIEQMSETFNSLAFDKNGSVGSNYTYKKIADAASNDKNNLIKTALSGSDKLSEFESVNTTFRTQIDRARKLIDTYAAKNENGTMLLDEIFKRGNERDISKIRSILGENSEEWDVMRATYLDNLFSNPKMHDKYGVIDFNKYVKHFEGLGEPVTNMIFASPGGLNKLRRLAHQAEKLDSSLLKDGVAPESFLDALLDFTGTYRTAKEGGLKAPIIYAKNLFIAGRARATVLDDLVDRKFLKMAQYADTKSEKDFWMKTRTALKWMRDNSVAVPIAKEGSSKSAALMRYVPTTLLNRLLHVPADMPMGKKVEDKQNVPAKNVEKLIEEI